MRGLGPGCVVKWPCAALSAVQLGLAGVVLPLFLALLAVQLAAATAHADDDACLAAHERAQVHRLRGRYVEARAELLTCAQASCPGLVRGDCKEWLHEIEVSLPSVVFAVADDMGRDLVDVQVSAGGTLLTERADGRALALNPGVYTLRFQAPGYAVHEQQLSVRESEKQRIVRVTLRAAAVAADAGKPSAGELADAAPGATPKAARGRRLLLASYVLGGLSVASLAPAIAYAVIGHDKLEELQPCKPNCDPSEVEEGRRNYTIANTAFATAGVLMGAAVITFVFGYRATHPSEQRGRVEVSADAQSLVLHWASRF